MIEREHIVRQGPGRRHDDRLKCPWCDMKWDYQNEKWTDHEADTIEHRELVCKKISKIEKLVESMVPWKYVYSMISVLVLVLGYIIVDHFTLSKQVSYNNAIIKNIDEKTNEFLSNQRHIMNTLRIDHLRDAEHK
jgi:hypothetical protein